MAIQWSRTSPYSTRMYLMNVPPVATTHTEWTRCGAQGGFSLPLCLHDSDSELSASGRPLSDKVQMIIESLRSSQSSLEMGDAIEGNVPSGQEGKPQVCKVPAGSFVRAKSNSKRKTKTQRVDCSYPDHDQRSDSDSDDSVDRGIEEAILEYLKEKDGLKRKAEPCFDVLQSPKIPRKTQFVSDVAKQNPESNECLITANKYLKTAQIESSTPRIIPIKKHIKYKHSLNANIVKRLDSNKIATSKSILPKEHTKSTSKAICVQCPVTVKTEECSDDSSSDDGIEEAIQRYQLEKKEQENRGESFNLLSFKDESDSTSDDGIEEAIRHYQLEQFKERHVLKPFLHKQKPFSKSLLHASDGVSVEKINKDKPKKKRTTTGKDPRCNRSPPTSNFTPKKSSLDCAKGKGNGSLQITADSCKEQHASTSAPPKVNTTAELMCAEAILDISKTVMPEAFHHGVGLSSTTPTESQLQVSLPENSLAEESDSSSVDSEDGIEQEIRKFLEQKAQMHKQPTISGANPQHRENVNGSEQMKTKVVMQKKPPRFSKIRKHSSIANISRTDKNVAAPNVLPENGKELNLLLSAERRQTRQIVDFHQIQQHDDESSSLDSDEDLDTAIKNLLKTKKKSKKKNRDLKWKSRKCLKEDGPTLARSVETKTLKSKTIFTEATLKKVKKSKDEPKMKSGLAKTGVPLPKLPHRDEVRDILDSKKGKFKATEGQEALLLHNTQAALQSKEDSSSADSDDGIEQEIQRFLAEKAKVSTGEMSQEGDVSTNGTAAVSSRLKDEGVKQRCHPSEIPVKNHSPQPGQSPLGAQRLLALQNLQPDISTADVQSRQSPIQSSGPSHLEPADGAGATRSEQTSNPERVGLQTLSAQVEKVPNSKLALSSPQSIKWRQSLGLPTPKSWTFGQTPFHITTSKIGETAAATPRRLVTPKSQSPVTVWSAARASRGPFPFSKETVVNATTKHPDSNPFHAARQHQRLSFTQNLAQGHRSQCPGPEGETKSLVSMPKDRCVFVELESNRTNHVQVRSEGKERAALLSGWKKEGEIMKTNDKEAHLERTEEEFIDEADCESSSRVNQEKRQGFPTL